LAKAAIDALGHIDIIASRAAAAVLARLGFNRYGQSRAYGFAKLAGYTALLTVGIAAQRMLAAKTRTYRRLLMRVIDRHLGLEHIFKRQRHTFDDFAQEKTS